MKVWNGLISPASEPVSSDRITLAVLRRDRDRRIAAADQHQVHVEARRAPIAVRKRVDGGQPEMPFESRGGLGRAEASPAEPLHQFGYPRRLGKHDWRARDAARQGRIDPGDPRLAAGDNAPMELAHDTVERRGGCGELAHPKHGIIMIDRLEWSRRLLPPTVIPGLDHLGGLAKGKRIPLDRVGRIGQFHIEMLLQLRQRSGRIAGAKGRAELSWPRFRRAGFAWLCS